MYVVTDILKTSKVSIALPFGSARLSAFIVPTLLTQGLAGAVVNHVTTQWQDWQESFLEEARRDLEETKQDLEGAKRDLEVFKKAYYILEQEKQALSDEIHQLKVRLFPPHTLRRLSRMLSATS